MATLSPNRLRDAENLFRSYGVELPAGHTLKDALDPAYWAHKADTLRPHDMIRIIPEEGDYFAEAVVVSAGRGFANLKLLRHVSLVEEGSTATNQVEEQMIVKWVSPANKFGVIRKSDGVRLREGFIAKADAQRWATDYLAAQDR